MDCAGSSRGRINRNQRRCYWERTPTPSPSPSPSSSPSPSPPTSPQHRSDIHFPIPIMKARYEQEFYYRPVLVGKDYDMAGLNEWFSFTDALRATGLIALMNLPSEIYIDLVRIFFSNATINEVIEDPNVIPWVDTGRQTSASITTYMFGCVLRITPDFINGLLQLTNGGEKLRKNWDMTNAFQRVFHGDSAQICAGERQADHLKHLKQKHLLPICRLIHHMIGYNICPRANSNNVSTEDVFIMDAMMDRRTLDVGYLVVQCMRRVLARKDTHLAYGRLVTYIMKSWGFDISTYTKAETRSKFTKDDIARRLGFRHNPQANQYYRYQSGAAQPGHENDLDDQGFDLNLDELSLPWHDEGMGEGSQAQGQQQQQQQPGMADMSDLKGCLENIMKVQEEHGEMLKAMNTRMDQFFDWSGYQTGYPRPPPPYQPPYGTDNQGGGGQSSHSHNFF